MMITVCSQCLSRHKTYACTTSSNYANIAFDGEKLFSLQRVGRSHCAEGCSEEKLIVLLRWILEVKSSALREIAADIELWGKSRPGMSWKKVQFRKHKEGF